MLKLEKSRQEHKIPNRVWIILFGIIKLYSKFFSYLQPKAVEFCFCRGIPSKSRAFFPFGSPFI